MKQTNKILEALKNNSLIALPTDTVYGLIGDPFSKLAVEKAYNFKTRDRNKPLSIFLSDKNLIKNICVTDNFIENFIDKKLFNDTIILRKKDKNYLNLISEDSIGIRIPNDEFVIKLLKSYGKPVFATSVNLAGEKECLTYADVVEKFSTKIDLIVENKNTISSCKPSSIYEYDGKNIKKVR